MLIMAIVERVVCDLEEIGAAVYDYLFYSGYVVLVYWWVWIVAVVDVLL